MGINGAPSGVVDIYDRLAGAQVGAAKSGLCGAHLGSEDRYQLRFLVALWLRIGDDPKSRKTAHAGDWLLAVYVMRVDSFWLSFTKSVPVDREP